MNMKDINSNVINVGDYLIIASKASVSHVMKVAKIFKKDKDKIYFKTVENDWRGLIVSKRNISLERHKVKDRIAIVDEKKVPEEFKKLLDGEERSDELNSSKNKDFFNNKIAVDKNCYVAKHHNNYSILVQGKIVKLQGKTIFYDIGGKICKTQKCNNILIVD